LRNSGVETSVWESLAMLVIAASLMEVLRRSDINGLLFPIMATFSRSS
jgi:hypothetical protein